LRSGSNRTLTRATLYRLTHRPNIRARATGFKRPRPEPDGQPGTDPLGSQPVDQAQITSNFRLKVLPCSIGGRSRFRSVFAPRVGHWATRAAATATAVCRLL
jgi:hypothetical protein